MRETINLDRDWLFHLGEVEHADYKGYDDCAWRIVTLPHDWSVEHPFDRCHSSGTGYLPGGVGWYRKHFILPQGIECKRVFVTFGGVYAHGRVWINGNYLGMRAYGYSSFTHELTGFVRAGENVLCVRAEHLHLADSRWFTGAGIYRDVTLTITDNVCFPPHAMFARTISADKKSAVIQVTAEAVGAQSVRMLLVDARKKVCAEANVSGDGKFDASLTLSSPSLWSPETPYLYTLRCEAICEGETRDAVEIPFGIRMAQFDAARGFLLNGQFTPLKGVCVHHDGGALGAAVPINVWERRLRKLIGAGCNAIRFSHNPPDPKLLDLCDRMGLMAIDEAFDEWEGCKNKWSQGHNVYPPKHYGYSDDFPEWHERDLRDMVLRDRNHPCIILWSIGNEIDYPNDPYVHASFSSMTGNNDANKPEAERRYDANKPDMRRLVPVAKELAGIVREIDPSRPVSAALAFPELSVRLGVADALDVVGYNYKEHLYDADHALYPDRPLFGSENSISPAAWLALRGKPYASGQFLWTGVDFLGEAKGWPIRVSQAGLIDTAGFEKPSYYQRKALWTEKLCAALAVTGKDEQARFAWEGCAGETMRVTCLTNAETARLYCNGQLISEQEVPDEAEVVWDIPFEAGEIRAECTRGSDIVEASLRTPGAPSALLLTPNSDALPADGCSVFQVEVLLTDAQGNAVCTNDLPVAYQLVGPGTLLAIENGRPDDLTPFTERTRLTRNGRAIIYVRAGIRPGIIRLFAVRDDGISGDVLLTTMS